MVFNTKKAEKVQFIFRLWAGKGYSLYSALGKVVKICVLPVAYFLSVPATSIASENDSSLVRLNLNEIKISATRAPDLFSENTRVLSVIEREEIEKMPAGSVQELLEQIAAIDVRQRGAEGVQADISIRGGTFDQAILLLNGMNITDPQTGHHNLNLPVSLSQVERIEVLEGPAARIYGPNAFSGAINIVTRQPQGKNLSAELNAGSFGFYDSGVSGSFKTGITNHLLAINRKSSHGFTGNTDFKISNLFYTGLLSTSGGSLTVQAGASGKGFGANSFYTPVYPNQYEQTRTFFSSAKWTSEKKANLTPSIYWRRHFDTFMLFRDNAPGWYTNHNFHRTDAWGAGLSSWFLWQGGKTSLGTDFRSENILSNVLGEKLNVPVQVPGENVFYTRSKTRNFTSAYFEHACYLNKWVLNAGIMAGHFSGNNPDWYFFPGIDMSFQFLQPLKLVASWNRSLRMPTFSDLYYSGPTNIGNPELKPEKSEALEGGFKWSARNMEGHLIVFRRKGENLIDWVKTPGDERWQSMNHTAINSSGAELNLSYQPGKNQQGKGLSKIQVNYLYNKLNKKESSLISYYLLDNLRHKLTVAITRSFLKNASAGLLFIYQDRAGTYPAYMNGKPAGEVSYTPFWLADLKLSYRIQNFRFFILANNLFNQEYFDLGNVPQPGRWIKSGVAIDLEFDRNKKI